MLGSLFGYISKRSTENLLLITFDQWRADWSNSDNIAIHLPNLKRLREAGLSIERCYTSSPQCIPARLSWITGLYPSQLGVTKNCPADLPNDAPSIIREIREKGWYTEIIGKTHWTNHRKESDLADNKKLLNELGFDKSNETAGPRALQRVRCNLTKDWLEEGVYDDHIADLKRRYGSGRSKKAWVVRPSVLPVHLYPDVWIAEKGIEAISKMPVNKPWLLWVSFVGPHDPYDTPKQWSKQKAGTLPKAIKRAEWINELSEECHLKQIALTWDDYLDSNDVENLRVDYANHTILLDELIGRLVAAAENRRDMRKTAMVVTSDHGDMLGDNEMLYKSTFMEPSIHVPMIYVPPKTKKKGMKMGAVHQKPVQLTKCLTQIIRNIGNDASIEYLRNQLKKESHVVVEYDREILIVKGKKKLCLDRKGEIMWAIDLKIDPLETINQAKNNDLTKEKAWKKIIEIGKEEVKRRENKLWVWRNIK